MYLGLVSCNQSPSSPPTKTTIENHSKLDTVDQLSIQINREYKQNVKRAKRILDNSQEIHLPLNFNNNYIHQEIRTDSALVDILLNKLNINILDSIFSYSAQEDSILIEKQKKYDPNKEYGEFLGTFNYHIPNAYIALFRIGKYIPKNGEYNPSNKLYVFVLNSTNLDIIDKVHIGDFYAPQMSRISDEVYYFNYSNTSISENMEILNSNQYNCYDSECPAYIHQFKLTKTGEIIKEPTISWLIPSYIFHKTGRNYTYLHIEDKVEISIGNHDILFGWWDGEDDDYFFSHLNMNLIDSSDFQSGNTLYFNDHLDRKWLEIYEYKPTLEKYSCIHKDENPNCNDAHYLRYVYNTLEDSTFNYALEVKYNHLTKNKLQLKTRYSHSKETLIDQDWKVITLYHNISEDSFPEEYENIDSYLADHPKPLYWGFSDYFEPIEKLPFDVSIEQVPNKEERKLLNQLLNL